MLNGTCRGIRRFSGALHSFLDSTLMELISKMSQYILLHCGYNSEWSVGLSTLFKY